MRKLCLLLLCCLIALSPLTACAESLTCYTGPGREYQTLDYQLSVGVNVTMMTLAYDDNGDPWVQIEISEGENLLRVYLPRENLNGDVSELSVEKRWEELVPEWFAQPYPEAVPRLGPGDQYNLLNYPITNGMDGVIILMEDGWGLYEMHLEESPIRFWVELGCLQY